MKEKDSHIQHIAEEQGMGSIVRGYVPPGFGLYSVLMVIVMIVAFIFFASQVSFGQWWLCLGFVEVLFLILILLAFVGRKWAVYEYAEGFIVCQGSDPIVVHWTDIAALHRNYTPRGYRNMADGDTTYYIRLKQGHEIKLHSNNYQEISRLISKIEARLHGLEQKKADHHEDSLQDSSPLFRDEDAASS